MNPHDFTWSSQELPVAAMIGGATLVGLVLTRDRKQFFVTRESVMLMLLMLWMTISLVVSFNPDGSKDMWSKVMKIDFMVLVTMTLLQTKRQIMVLVGVIAFSLGFYGVKGGIFTIMTGGSYKVWGPGGFIGGNNEIALALVMVIPLMRFLQLQTTRLWSRHAWTAAMILTAAAALGSQSRGALLAIGAMAAYLWIKSRQRLGLGIVLVAIGFVLITSMPEEWSARMETIQTYQQDNSAMGRINAWNMAFNLAKDRFTGGGFDIYTPEIFARYAPHPESVAAAHSIYFQMLGEHGFVGLALYLIMWSFVWRSAAELIRRGKVLPQAAWCRDLGAMAQASLLGFAVGGAFLSLAYFDLPYDILAIIVLARRWVETKGWENEVAPTKLGRVTGTPVSAPGS
jgi:probable O-glycosylation ligase (exosortase A-associated)